MDKKYKRDKFSSIGMVEDESGKHYVSYQDEPAHLYLVCIERPIEGQYPITAQFYVLAQDEKNAIKQVEVNMYPEQTYYASDAQRAALTSTATRIPFQIRGWGCQTF